MFRPSTSARRLAGLIASVLLLVVLPGIVNGVAAAGSRLLATGGVTNVNGSAGGGLTTWALLNGYASDTEDSVNANVSYTGVDDFNMQTVSLGYNWGNRLAITLARNKLDVEPIHTHIEQQTVGIKLRLTGDAIYSRFGQLATGLQYTHNSDIGIGRSLGARDAAGVDFYLAASKIFLAALANRNVIVNATARATRANQLGLLGFGSEQDNSYDLVGEFSAGLLVTPHWMIGAEYRQKPNKLRAADEDDWQSLFLMYAPSKYLAMTLAYADLGDIAGFADQTGYYFALQSGF